MLTRAPIYAAGQAQTTTKHEVTAWAGYTAGALADFYLKSGTDPTAAALEIADTPTLAIGSPGKILKVTGNNNTATLNYAEYRPGGIQPASGVSWEVLACVYLDQDSVRIGVGYMDGVADATSYAAVTTQFYSDRVQMNGTATTTQNVTATRASYISKWLWLNIRYDGASTVKARFWLHGSARPDWTHSQSYTAPGSPSAYSGLGMFLSSQYTTARHAEVCYFEAVTNQPELPLPSWANPEFPTIAAGSLAYLNAWDPVAYTPSRFASLFSTTGYPLLAVGDHQGDYSTGTFADEYVAHFNLFSTTTGGAFTSRAGSSGITLIKCTDQELQLNDNTWNSNATVNYLSDYTSYAQRRMTPKHLAWQAGTTLGGALPAGASLVSNFSVADASAIVVSKHALIRPSVSNWGGSSAWELVYVTARNTTNNTITFYRGFSAPNIMATANQRSHVQGAYICSVVGGGAQTATKSAAIPGGGTVAVTYNWRFNLSTQCPTDTNGTQVHPHIVDWYKARFDDIKARYGAYPDGSQNDVDMSYPTLATEENLDANNDGVMDLGRSSFTASDAVNWWEAGVAQLETAILAAVGPGTTYDAAIFLNGTHQCPAPRYNGYEQEMCFATTNWSGPATYTRLNQGILNWNYWYDQVARNGEPTPINLCRLYTLTHPDMQNDGTHDPNYSVTDNCDFRLNYCLTQILGGFFAMPMSGDRINWWDEYAADRTDNYRCPVFGTEDALILSLRGWMGAPKAKYVRHYNATSMDKANNISTLSWASANPSLTLTAMSPVYVTSGGPGGSAPYGRYTQTGGIGSSVASRQIAKTVSGLTQNAFYTIALTLRSSVQRELTVALTNVFTKSASTSSTGQITLDTTWRTYVFNVQATSTSIWLALQAGFHPGEIHIAEWLVVPGNTAGLSRDFEYALVLANPSAEAFTFTLPNGATYRRLNGTQDSTINSGAQVTGSVTVPAMDGLVLGKVQ